MAGTIKGIKVEIGGETVDLKKSIDDVVKKSQELQKELKDVDKQLKFDPSNTVLLAQKQELLEEKIGATKEELKRLESVQDQVEKQAKNGDIGAEKYRKYQREIETTKGVLKNFEKQLGECKSAQEDAAASANKIDLSKYKKEIDGVKDSAEKLKGTLKDTATGLGAGLGAAGAAAVGAVKSYDSVESALNSIQAQTGLTDDKMADLKGTMESIYKSGIGESMDDIAGKMANIIQFTGETDPQKLQNYTQSLITMEDTFGMDFNETLRGVQGLIKNMGLSADEAFDLMASGAQNGLDYTHELGDNIAEYSQIWGQAGFSANEMFAILDNGTKSGAYNLDKVNDFVKEFTISLSDGRIEKNINSFSSNTADLFGKWKEGKATAAEVFKSVINNLATAENKQEALTLASETWSALGEDNAMDVITSLGNVNTKFDDVKGTMQSVNDVKYDDVTNDINSLGRTIQTDIINPLVEEAYPDIKEGIEWVSENLDKVIPIIQGIGREVGIVWSAKKINDIVSGVTDLYKAYKTLKKSTDAAKASQIALTMAQNTNVVGLVITAVGTLANVLYTLYDANKDVEDSTDKLKEKQEKEREEVDDLKKSYTDFVDTKNQKLSENTSEFQYYRDLWGELGKIVDRNGKVKEGYEERAKFITEKMEDITGDEITYNGNVIISYANLRTEIEKYLKVKEAEAALSAIEPSYTEAIQKRSQAAIDAATAYNDWIEKTEKLNKRKADLSEVLKVDPSDHDAVVEWYRKTFAIPEDEYISWDFATDAMAKYESNARGDVSFFEEKVANAKDKYINLTDTVAEYNRTITYYEDLTAAVVTGDTEKISDALDTLNENFITAGNGTENELKNQKEKLAQNLDDLKGALANGADGVTQEMVDKAQKLYDASSEELEKYLEENGKVSEKVEKQASDNVDAVAKRRAKILRDNAKSLKEQYKNGVPGITESTVKAAEAAAEYTEKELKEIDGITDKHNKNQKEKTKKGVDDVNNEAGKINVSGAVESDMSGAVDNMSIKGGELSGAMTTAATNTKNAAKVGGWSWIGSTWIGGIIGGIFGRNEDVANAGETSANQAKAGAGRVSLFTKGLNLVGSFISGIFNRNGDAENAGSTVADSAKTGAGGVSAFDDGNNFTQGFVNGIKNGNAFGLIASAAEAVGSAAWTALRKFLGIESPSKLAAEDGEYFTEGFAVGIPKKAHLAIDNAKKLAADTYKALQSEKYDINATIKSVDGLMSASRAAAFTNSTVKNSKNITFAPNINVNVPQTQIKDGIDGEIIGRQISNILAKEILQDGMKWG